MNLKSKILLGVFIALCGVIVSQFFYYKSESADKDNEIFELKTVRLKDLKQQRDEAFNQIDTLSKNSKRRFDSIINLPPTIKWRKYEVPTYVDRSLDDALDIHAEHKADKGARTED